MGLSGEVSELSFEEAAKVRVESCSCQLVVRKGEIRDS